jgi:MOSC domain-containing protein YiiM
METLEKIISTHYMNVQGLYLARGHSFFGRHGQPAAENPIIEVRVVECVAGRGLRGDRFFDYKENYKGQVTFFALETYLSACRELGVEDKPPSTFRRNVITVGVDLNELIGHEFRIQGVHFRGTEECRPCYWMDQAFAPGAHEFLKGRGGLRAEILSDGFLRTPCDDH